MTTSFIRKQACKSSGNFFLRTHSADVVSTPKKQVFIVEESVAVHLHTNI